MARSEWQFSLRGGLLATLWVAVALGCYAAITKAHQLRAPFPAEVPLTWIMMVCPFIAVGALLGRSLEGAAIGIGTVSLFWLIWQLA